MTAIVFAYSRIDFKKPISGMTYFQIDISSNQSNGDVDNIDILHKAFTSNENS